MRVCCLSDLHGREPVVDPCDLIIIAGDITACHSVREWMAWFLWVSSLPADRVIVVPGNHDTFLQENHCVQDLIGLDGEKVRVLVDAGEEYKGLKIWGSPWTRWFKGMNPLCMAYVVPDESGFKEHFSKIPQDTDILITHSPAFGCLDFINPLPCYRLSQGSVCLRDQVERVSPRLHVFGHIHECGGEFYQHECGTLAVNAALYGRRSEYKGPIYINLG